jgi:hypothetical protein
MHPIKLECVFCHAQNGVLIETDKWMSRQHNPMHSLPKQKQSNDENRRMRSMNHTTQTYSSLVRKYCRKVRSGIREILQITRRRLHEDFSGFGIGLLK